MFGVYNCYDLFDGNGDAKESIPAFFTKKNMAVTS